jgi:calpain-7
MLGYGYDFLCYRTSRLNPVSDVPITQYYEAIYLMKRYLQRLPQTQSEEEARQLVLEKVKYYERIAQMLMTDNRSTEKINARSPVEGGVFFQEDSDDAFIVPLSVVPIPDPPPPPAALHPIASMSPTTGKQNALTRKIGEANQKLAQALDMDEMGETAAAIDLYMKAAEFYLHALQLAETDEPGAQSVTTIVKRRLESTLDRVERLKHPASPEKKTLIPNERQAGQHKQAPAVSTQSCPSSVLTPAEIDILKRSSLIASGVYLPWSDEDSVDLLVQARKQPVRLYTDPSGFLSLSDNQKKHFFKWARPTEIVTLRQQTGATKARQTPVMVNAITPYTIKQQYVTDCSFIASLCICAAYERRFPKRLITSVLYPQTERGDLVYNPSGKYMVKLWLNGVARCVTIDDYLPIDKYGNVLCSLSSSREHPSHLELWVCLIEKAFLKLAGGGYGFPGSNSGVDLFSLTGWIPESVIFAKEPDKVADYETPPERAWERIFSACSYGDCLITVSSSLQLEENEAAAIGIVTGHAYAVLSVIETKNGTRLLQLKNPWAHKSWKGRFSSGDSASWQDPQFRAEVGYNPDLAVRQDDGVFWICWQDVLRYFENFHLSWNPGLFSHRTTIHDFWPKDVGPTQDTYNIGENPQYTLELSDKAIAQNASIWILLSRHVSKQEQLEGKVSYQIYSGAQSCST